MIAKSKGQAILKAASHFMPKKPCSKGHLTVRNTKSGACLECGRIRKTKQRRSDGIPVHVPDPAIEAQADEVFNMRHRQGMRPGEIARELGISLHQYQRRINRAHKKRQITFTQDLFRRDDDKTDIRLWQQPSRPAREGGGPGSPQAPRGYRRSGGGDPG